MAQSFRLVVGRWNKTEEKHQNVKSITIWYVSSDLLSFLSSTMKAVLTHNSQRRVITNQSLDRPCPKTSAGFRWNFRVLYVLLIKLYLMIWFLMTFSVVALPVAHVPHGQAMSAKPCAWPGLWSWIRNVT